MSSTQTYNNVDPIFILPYRNTPEDYTIRLPGFYYIETIGTYELSIEVPKGSFVIVNTPYNLLFSGNIVSHTNIPVSPVASASHNVFYKLDNNTFILFSQI